MLLKRIKKMLSQGSKLSGEALPENHRVYAIGDIHGRFDLLTRLHTEIIDDFENRSCESAEIVLLGDYVDRGPDSALVLNWLSDPKTSTLPRVCLMGNHEQMFISYYQNQNILRDWQRVGGLETLRSIGVDVPIHVASDEFTRVHLEFLKKVSENWYFFLTNLRETYVRGNFIFVHAGLRPGISFEKQHTHDLLWIRNEFLEYRGSFPGFVVHGHTPVNQVDLHPNRLNIDTGSFISNTLSCAVLENANLRFIQASGQSVLHFDADSIPE